MECRGPCASARVGDPFVAANVRHLRVVAALTFGYFVLRLVRTLVAVVIHHDLGLDSSDPDVSFAPAVSAVVLLALAQVWQHGVNLRADQELTV